MFIAKAGRRRQDGLPLRQIWQEACTDPRHAKTTAGKGNDTFKILKGVLPSLAEITI